MPLALETRLNVHLITVLMSANSLPVLIVRLALIRHVELISRHVLVWSLSNKSHFSSKKLLIIMNTAEEMDFKPTKPCSCRSQYCNGVRIRKVSVMALTRPKSRVKTSPYNQEAIIMPFAQNLYQTRISARGQALNPSMFLQAPFG